ncbi:amidohydrolase family protein [Actinomadura sp. KC06]|uniref:amidohydrolase family protein n=1 Tax=Actinomadura sp. KC06 TaxID=2530369 RepID=UPI001A9EFF43|nr:amidohydrolase family protein [Actinomadura sp. KC06]
MEISLDWLVSVDDHVLEPPHVWQDRLPAGLKEAGPRIVRDDQGEAWVFEGKRMPTTGLSAAAGKKREEFSPLPVTYEDMRPGCYEPAARIEDMNRAGVLASLSFPSFPRFCGQAFTEADDRELGLACVKAYNDWMIEEWCATAPGRLIPMIILPLWDPRLAAEEIERTAAMGARAIAFSENPYQLGLPSIHDPSGHWEPMIAAAAETGMPICMHLGSSSRLPATSPDMPMAGVIALTPVASTAAACIDWLFSPWLPRYPDLKLCLSEGGIGWIPYVLERCDHVVEVHRAWAAKGDFGGGDLTTGSVGDRSDLGGLDLSVLPSERFRQHIFGCFIEDPFGVGAIEKIGVDNVMIETDYPHTDSTWPNSIEVAHKELAGLSDEVKRKVMQTNAARVFNLELPEPPATRQ